jgi:hypothetical protein
MAPGVVDVDVHSDATRTIWSDPARGTRTLWPSRSAFSFTPYATR